MLVIIDATYETIARLLNMGYYTTGVVQVGELYTPDLIMVNTTIMQYTLLVDSNLAEGIRNCSIEDLEAIHVLPTEDAAKCYMKEVVKDISEHERVKPYSPRGKFIPESGCVSY